MSKCKWGFIYTDIIFCIFGVFNFLKEKGIGTRRFFYPLHLQPCYSDFSQDLNSENFKNSLKSYNTALSLPSLYSLTNEDQKYIIKTIKSYYE